ncbi:MAG: hypothetical protein RQ875_14045 [Vicingaceae bacterium]|nr:hypothetical protein [Vicingaceae bacterium]
MDNTYKRNKIFPIIIILISIILVIHGITVSLFMFINELLAIVFSILGFLYGFFGLFKPYAKIEKRILHVYINPFRTDKRELKNIKTININGKKLVLKDNVNQKYTIDLTYFDSKIRNAFVEEVCQESNIQAAS